MSLMVMRPLELRHGLVALILFAPLVDGGTTYAPATVIRLGALALAVWWLMGALRPGGGWRRTTPLDLPIVLFMILAAISTATSSNAYESLQVFLALATGALVLAVAVEVARDPRGSRWIAGAVVGGAVAQALLVLAQWAGGIERPAGTYFNPNHAAMALAMSGAMLLAAWPASRVLRAGAWVAVVLVAAALVATRSRGGLLAALAGCGLVGWYRWRWRAAAVAVAAAAALVIVPNPVSERMRDMHGHDPLAYKRIEIWGSAVERALDHPLGVGLGLFGHSSQQYAFPVEGEVARYGRRAESAHSEYLQILAELGAPGLALALWALAALAVAARRAPGQKRPLHLGAAGAVAVVAAQAMVDVPLQVPALVVQTAALAGLLLAARSDGRGPIEEAEPRPAFVGGTGRRVLRFAAVGLGCVAAAGVARHGLGYFAYERAGAARAAGNLAVARAWFERATWFAPDSALYPDALAAASVVAWQTSRDPKDAMVAEQMMTQAMRLDPENAERYARLAQVYRHIRPADPAVRRAALERAKAMYEVAERIDPHRALFAFERAEVLLLLGDRDGSIAALERAIDLEPRFLPARLNLARLLAARGARTEAAAQYAAIEATLAAYERADARAAAGPMLPAFLGVDRAAVRREAEQLGAGAS